MIIQEKFWIIMAAMMLLPFIVFMVLPDPYASVAIIGGNLFMLLYIRKFWKGIAGSMLGTKIGLVCSVCNGKKFDKNGTCKKCGNKSRRLG